MQKHFFADVWLGSKYACGSLDAPYKVVLLNSFILQYLCYNQFISLSSFWRRKYYIQKHLTANFTRFTLNATFTAPILDIGMFNIEVNQEHFNLQEWPQNMWNCKSLYQQIFIVYKTFTRCLIKQPHVQDDCFWVVLRVVVLYRFDCSFIRMTSISLLFLPTTCLYKIMKLWNFGLYCYR